MRSALSAVVLGVAGISTAVAAPINTSDPTLISAFSQGATVQTFENISGMTPLSLSSYANALDSSTAVPAAAQLGGQIAGLHFHSGGASFNDPVGNPGTPAALLSLEGDIAGDAASATNVVGSLEINTENLDLDNFVEVIFINALQSRVGVHLNPSLGDVLLTAFDSTGQSLESASGTAGNFVGIERAAADIKFISLVGGNSGFTIDDFTYARGEPAPVPEPATLALLLGQFGVLTGAAWFAQRRTRKDR